MNFEEEMFHLQNQIKEQEKEDEFHNFINLQVINKIDEHFNNPVYLWESHKPKKKKKIILYRDTIPDFIDDPAKSKRNKLRK